MEDGAIKIPKLVGASNYELWAIHIKAALTAKDLFDFYTRSGDLNAKGLKNNAKALSYIQLAYTDELLLYILILTNLTEA